MFLSLEYSWQTAPCTSATIAIISTKGMFSLSSSTWLTPLSHGQLSKVSAWLTVFHWEKYWERICTGVEYTTRRRKNWKMRILWREADYISERREMRANQLHKHCKMRLWTNTFMRTSWRRLSTVYICIGDMGNEVKPRPRPLQHEDMTHPFQTVQCALTIPHIPHIFVSVKYLSWRCLNGQGPWRELGLRECVPGTLDNGRRREKRRSRRDYAIHPRVQRRQPRVKP